MADKVISMIEVSQEIYGVYKNDDGTEGYSRVIFAAMIVSEYGPMVSLIEKDTEGAFDVTERAGNFLRYHYGPPPDGADIW